MTEAEHLYNQTFSRWVDKWVLIYSLIEVAEAGLPYAEKVISAKKKLLMQELVDNPRHEGILKDKVKFVEAGGPEAFAEKLTKESVRGARTSIDAACVVFAHSVLDDTALNYCRTSILLAPDDWAQEVENKKVPLSEYKSMPYKDLLKVQLEAYLHNLERESLMLKSDLLFQRCRPPSGWNPMSNYTFDRDKLKKIDTLRHEIVHGDILGKEIPAVHDMIEYMNLTGFFYMFLINHKYKMKIDPEFRKTNQVGEVLN